MATYEGLLGGTRVDRAVARLHAILPLSKMLEGCGEDARALHSRLLETWLQTGVPLSRKEMEESEPTAAARALLEKSGLVLFDNETGEVSGAYPLTTEERAHRVAAGGLELRAMCALDALAIGPMLGLGETATVQSSCEVTGEAVTVEMAGTALRGDSAAPECAVQVGVGWNAAKEGVSCASSICTQIVFLKDAATATEWREDPTATLQSPRAPLAVTDTPIATREVFSLPDAVKFAVQFFRALGAREQPDREEDDAAAAMDTDDAAASSEAAAGKKGEADNEEGGGLAISDPEAVEETEFLVLKGRPAPEYFGKLDSHTHGTDVRHHHRRRRLLLSPRSWHLTREPLP